MWSTSLQKTKANKNISYLITDHYSQLKSHFNNWFYALRGDDGFFASAWAKVVVNMACRGATAGKIHLKHLTLADAGDFFGIPNCQSKDNQTGTDPGKTIAPIYQV